MMTRQEIFTKVVTHLRAQGVCARDEMGCAYRGAYGTKCAAGCLIPDELYTPAIERSRVGNGQLVDTILRQSGVADADLQFVKVLQFIHDDGEETWEADFANYARKFELELPA